MSSRSAVTLNWVESVALVVTRAAAMDGFERYVEDAFEATMAEFSVARALRRGTRGPGDVAVDRLLKNSDLLHERVVEPELEAYRGRIVDQFEVVLDAAEDDAPFDAYRDQLLELDSYVRALRPDVSPDRREQVCETALARNRRLAEGVEPLVAAPEDEFWAAVEYAYDRETATDLVGELFAFTGPLRDHRDAVAMTVTVDPAAVLGGLAGALGGLPTLTIDYTDEALRAMVRAEERVVADSRREVERRL